MPFCDAALSSSNAFLGCRMKCSRENYIRGARMRKVPPSATHLLCSGFSLACAHSQWTGSLICAVGLNPPHHRGALHAHSSACAAAHRGRACSGSRRSGARRRCSSRRSCSTAPAWATRPTSPTVRACSHLLHPSGLQLKQHAAGRHAPCICCTCCCSPCIAPASLCMHAGASQALCSRAGS